MKKIKEMLISKNGMKIVNVLFLLSAIIRNRGIIFAAYIVWIIYLIYCIKHVQTKSEKIVYTVFLIFAVAMILINGYFLIFRG